MARIQSEELERMKAEISLERLAERRGVKLRRHGKDLLGLCPFHEDKSPSLVISPEQNLWHCLGACQAGGSVIDWVMRAEGVSFRHAVELLRADLPSLDAEPPRRGGRQQGPVAKHSTVQKLPTPIERSAADEVLLRQVVDYYHEALKQSPEALAYLEQRGLGSGELIERFRLGFANRTLGYRLPHKNRQAGAELRGQLQRLGVLRPSGHEHFNGSIVMPVIDQQGRVTELYGRKITSRLRTGTPLHLYLPGPHRGLWNLEAVAASKELILCESLIDAATFWCAGHRNVTASYGVEGFTDEHRAALGEHGTERVLIAYDRDEAGERAAVKLARELGELGVECFRVKFPRGMDANEYALKLRPASQGLAMLLRQAVWMGKGPAPAPGEPVSVMGTGSEVAGAAKKRTVEAGGEVEGEPSTVEPIDASAALLQQGGATELTALEQPGSSEPGSSDPDVAAGNQPSGNQSANGQVSSHHRGSIPSLAAQPETPPQAEEPAVLEARDQDARVQTPSRARTPTRGAATQDEVSYRWGERRWRVRGLSKNTTPEVLKVNLLVARDGGGFHVDTLELYSARQRAHFTKLGSEELGLEERILKKDLGQVLLKLEEHQDQQLKQAQASESKRPKLSDEQTREALELLRDPKLLDRLLADFDRCGVVGEETNKLVGYLAAVSRKLDEPLAIIIQSSSAAGKSWLMEAVLSLMPEEERVQYSAMTGQSLFYMGEQDLRHRILAIVEEEGAERASYALKLLQSEGQLTIASTGKDPTTGRLVTQEYRVEGPVMIFLTTTAIEVDEELLNRCIVLTVDEGREQTRAIHERQRRSQTLEGVLAKHDRERVLQVHRNAQRLLRPLTVVNPYASELTFLDHQTRTRRDHLKYLTLIRTIALLHQYQRPVKTAEHRGQRIRYVEVTREDIRVANRLAHEVLGRSLDELPPQTRTLLGLLDEMVRGESDRLGFDRTDFRFSRRQVRESTRWGNTQLKVHLGRLLELEYVMAHRGRQGQAFQYELCYAGEGRSGAPFLPGLIDVRGLASHAGDGSTIRTSRGSEGDFAGVGRPLVGVRSGGGRGGKNAAVQHQSGSNGDRAAACDQNPRRGNQSNGAAVVAVPPSPRSAHPSAAVATASPPASATPLAAVATAVNADVS